MSTCIYKTNEMTVNRFWVGEKKGVCYQFTPDNKYALVTKKDLKKLTEILSRETDTINENKIRGLNKSLKEVKKEIKKLKNKKINKDLLIVYLKNKTKLSQKDIQLMLKSPNKFILKYKAQLVAEAI